MQIQVLRSVALRLDGDLAPLRSERARSLLAALAWQPGEVVADHTVIDRIWGRRLPIHPQDSLYTCANRLRALMRKAVPGAERSISRLRGGYVFAVDPQQIDLHRFRDLTRRAHAAMRADDVQTAIALFDDGLGLWGEASMPDLTTEWVERVRVALDSERLAAQVARAEAAVRLGRYREELPRLQQLANLHPLDERIAGLLMIVMARSGRGCEAMSHYRGLRTRMLSEVGDEPGHYIQELHEQILRRSVETEHVMTTVFS